MTQQEALQENIKKLILDELGEGGKERFTEDELNVVVFNLSQYFNAYVAEVIGEDDETDREKDYMAYENFQKNELRIAQRLRAGL